MKKLLTVVLCLVLALSTATMMGCSKSTFDGDYQETDVATVEQMAAEIAEAEGGEELDYGQGVKLAFDMDVASGELSGELKMDIKAIAVEEDLQMQGSMTMTEGEESQTGEMYFTEGYMYTAATYEGQTMKMKVPMTIDDLIGNYVNEMGSDVTYSISEVLDMMEGAEGVKWYVEDKEDSKKIKVEYADEEMGEVKVILVYNGQYKLIAVSYEMSMSMTMGEETMTMNLNMTVEPWSGSISLPTDLNTYTEMPM